MRTVCGRLRVRDLVVGDRIRTTAHRWETIVQLDRAGMRSMRVFTAESGSCPWHLTNTHLIAVQPASLRQTISLPAGLAVAA